jgi:hypothetical protein
MDSTWILDKKLAGLPPKKKLSKLHMDSGNPHGIHMESTWNLWLRVKSSVHMELNASVISGFPGQFIPTCPVHIELNAPDISGFPGHFILTCLVSIKLNALEILYL